MYVYIHIHMYILWFAPHWHLPLTSQPEIAQARLFSHANPERSQSETTAAGNDRCNCCCKTPKVVLSLTKPATALMAQAQPHPTLHVLTTADTAISYRNIRFLRDPPWTGTCITEEGGKANMTRMLVQFTVPKEDFVLKVLTKRLKNHLLHVHKFEAISLGCGWRLFPSAPHFHRGDCIAAFGACVSRNGCAWFWSKHLPTVLLSAPT